MVALIGYGLLGIVVAVGVVALLVLVLPNDHLAAAPRDIVPAGLPSQPEIDGADVARVRLPVSLRGYRMVDTDAVLDRLALELEHRDQEIADLRRMAGLPERPGEVFGVDDESAGDEFTGDEFTGGEFTGDEFTGDDFAVDDEVLGGPAAHPAYVSPDAVGDGPYAESDDSPSHPIDAAPHHGSVTAAAGSAATDAAATDLAVAADPAASDARTSR